MKKIYGVYFEENGELHNIHGRIDQNNRVFGYEEMEYAMAEAVGLRSFGKKASICEMLIENVDVTVSIDGTTKYDGGLFRLTKLDIEVKTDEQFAKFMKDMGVSNYEEFIEYLLRED